MSAHTPFNFHILILHVRCIVLACGCAVHKKCHLRVLHKCPGNAKDSRETKILTERMGINIPHSYTSYTDDLSAHYWVLTYSDHSSPWNPYCRPKSHTLTRCLRLSNWILHRVFVPKNCHITLYVWMLMGICMYSRLDIYNFLNIKGWLNGYYTACGS